MTLRETYETLFPAPIARRMIEQADTERIAEMQKWERKLPYHNLLRFCHWKTTSEGPPFWGDLANLYYYNPTPTEEQIKAVFAAHNIEYK